jgi:hypothetical protein
VKATTFRIEGLHLYLYTQEDTLENVALARKLIE